MFWSACTVFRNILNKIHEASRVSDLLILILDTNTQVVSFLHFKETYCFLWFCNEVWKTVFLFFLLKRTIRRGKIHKVQWEKRRVMKTPDTVSWAHITMIGILFFSFWTFLANKRYFRFSKAKFIKKAISLKINSAQRIVRCALLLLFLLFAVTGNGND